MPRMRRDKEVPAGFIRCADLGEVVQIDHAIECQMCRNLYCRDCVTEIFEDGWYCEVCRGFDIVDRATRTVWRGSKSSPTYEVWREHDKSEK